ncbi:MAG: formyltransferase family protein [Fodinibius sp.]|nr:formyltransferase family protein [Fodinibius sp.]
MPSKRAKSTVVLPDLSLIKMIFRQSSELTSHDIPHATLAPSHFDSQDDYINTLLEQLASLDTDLIALAGYMIKIPAAIIEQYEGRIVNIHPSLLTQIRWQRILWDERTPCRN